jgi:hypothetical protein
MLTMAGAAAGAWRNADQPATAMLAGNIILRIGFLFVSLAWLTTAASKANAANTADPLDPVLAVDVSYWSGYIIDGEVACWRARAQNVYGWGEWSAYATFDFAG